MLSVRGGGGWRAALGALVAAYLALGLSLFAAAPVATETDTERLRATASLPLRSASFWAAERPPTVPLLYKLAGHDDGRIVVAQLLLGWCAWIALALSVHRALRHPALKLAGAALMLGLGLSVDLFFWNKVLLSESASFSLFAATVAVALAALGGDAAAGGSGRARRPGAALALLAVAALWACARDANAYVVLGVALACGLARIVWRRETRRDATFWRLLTAGLLTVFALVGASADRGGRWRFPLVNVLSQRVLTDPAATRFFVARAMPVDDGVTRFRGRWASDFGADWSGFEPWLDRRGRRVYAAWILSRPLAHAREPLAAWEPFFDSEPRSYAQDPSPPPRWQSALSRVVYPKRGALIALLCLAVGALCWAARRRALSPAFGVPVVLLALAYPVAFVCWHADPMEVMRHGLGMALQTRLGAWLALLLCADALLGGRRG